MTHVPWNMRTPQTQVHRLRRWAPWDPSGRLNRETVTRRDRKVWEREHDRQKIRSMKRLVLTKRFRRRRDHAATAEWQHRGNQTGFQLADSRVIQTLCEKRSCRGRNDECRHNKLWTKVCSNQERLHETIPLLKNLSALLCWPFWRPFHCLTTGNKLSVLMLEPLLNSTAAVAWYSQQWDHTFIKDFNVYDHDE